MSSALSGLGPRQNIRHTGSMQPFDRGALSWGSRRVLCMAGATHTQDASVATAIKACKRHLIDRANAGSAL
eukprot:1324352-Amorphochlora_amoeboformis.AAC.1